MMSNNQWEERRGEERRGEERRGEERRGEERRREPINAMLQKAIMATILPYKTK
jgi:hypothetical protein